MPELTVVVLLSGLIAFVPNDSRHASFGTAYLLDTSGDECQHAGTLRVIGCFDKVEPNDFGCASVDGWLRCNLAKCEDEQGKIRCTVFDVDVSLEPAPREPLRFLRDKPASLLPDNVADGEDISWLLRIGNLGGGLRRAMTWGDELEKKVGTRFRFGWEEAKTCQFDEGGEKTVYSFEFCSFGQDGEPNCAASGPNQAIAESVMFRVPVDAGPIRLVLRERGMPFNRARKTIVNLKCPGGLCPIIRIDNNMVGAQHCGDHNMEYGIHFKHFYELTRTEDSSTFFVPHRLGTSVVESRVSRKCGLETYEINLSKKCKLENPLFYPRTDDRVICPPALIDP